MKRFAQMFVERIQPATLDTLQKAAARLAVRTLVFCGYVLALWAAFNAAPVPYCVLGGTLSLVGAAGIVGLAWVCHHALKAVWHTRPRLDNAEVPRG